MNYKVEKDVQSSITLDQCHNLGHIALSQLIVNCFHHYQMELSKGLEFIKPIKKFSSNGFKFQQQVMLAIFVIYLLIRVSIVSFRFFWFQETQGGQFCHTLSIQINTCIVDPRHSNKKFKIWLTLTKRCSSTQPSNTLQQSQLSKTRFMVQYT